MLTSLHVSNYILIDSLDISFPGGLIIITGQTGAGKSILLGALSMALGAKVDSSSVGPHGDNCVVEAVFDIEGNAPVLEILKENDLEPEGGSLVLRRVLSRTGRSRCFADDCPVTVGLLQQIGAHLVDVHSQHQNLKLSDASFKLSLLDLFAGSGELLSSCRRLWGELSSTKAGIASVKASISALKAGKEYNEAQLSRLDQARLQEGELEELEAEQKRLANAEQIRSGLSSALGTIAPDDGASAPVSALLKEASRTLSRLAQFIPSAGDLSSRIDSARLEISDIEEELESELSAMDVSPGRLEQVDDRIGEIYGLFNRYGVNDVQSLIALREEFRGKVGGVTSLDDELAELESRYAALEKEYVSTADRLHSVRAQAARPLSEAVQSSLRFLELESATFDVTLETTVPGPAGHDAAAFLFSSSGKAPLDVSKAASGGEMSRIMLCIKDIMARFTKMPTLVFDEIDTGVSGSAADKMGAMICSMGENMQVFAITHLPQVAAKGKAHYVVSKHENVTAIARVEGDDRINEIARMLSGSDLTPQAVENAKVLIRES